MGRYDRRIRRLAQQVKETQPARQQARIARMSDEELIARMIKPSLVLGMPEEMTSDPQAMIAWNTNYLRKARETMTEEEWDRILGMGSIRAD